MKGIVFTLIAVLIGLSLFTLFTNYRLYTSELATVSIKDTSVAVPFDYVGTHIAAIADVDISVSRNRSHTFLNFTDRAPRVQPFNHSLAAYSTFLEDKTNLTAGVDINLTEFLATPLFNISTIGAYNYTNFTKHNITVAMRDDALFVEKYELNITALDPAAGAASISTLTNPGSGNLSIRIVSGSTVLLDNTAVARSGSTGAWRITFAGISDSVNVTVGEISNQRSSLRVSPGVKSEIKTVVIIRTAQLPA